MSLHGRNFIGGKLSSEGTTVIQARSPLSGTMLDTEFVAATEAEVDSAVRQAAAASESKVGTEQRSRFLRAVADNLLSAGEAILEKAHQETALPMARLTGERMRTVNQLRMFADLVEEGSWVDARIDRADPERKPAPRPDIRRMLTPIGPVAVFGASNFPFAYSVAGGDTASALAAGCPVVVKAHPAHPGTSEMTAAAVAAAAASCGMPDGIFSMLHGEAATGQALIKHPDLAAAGFTGSLAGGRALCDSAAARPRPIPVHAEMGSVNPVLLLPGAVEKNGTAIAAGLAQSVTLGTGQFCVNPGLIIAIDSPTMRSLISELGSLISGAATFPMLTSRISDTYFSGLKRMGSNGAKTIVCPDGPGAATFGATFQVDASVFLRTPELAEEVFGPVTLIVLCQDDAQLFEVATSITGQLTGTVHAEGDDYARYSTLIETVTRRVGRVIFNGYPTNVEVIPSMQHGGPYPATSDARFTSVGTAAIYRFSRPVCWQNAPQSVLPLELQDSNKLNIRRLVDGDLTQGPIS